MSVCSQGNCKTICVICGSQVGATGSNAHLCSTCARSAGTNKCLVCKQSRKGSTVARVCKKCFNSRRKPNTCMKCGGKTN